MDTYQIRTMTIKDYEEVYTLWTTIHGFCMRSLDDSKEGVQRFLQRNPSTSVVAVVKEENKEKIEMLIKTFFNRLKGYHVQYYVVSKVLLLDAQAHPEKHKDLIVRVAGYSAFFNVLSKATQDDIIGRTEQTL